jgi:4'-phosphopantetheinyl transferase EntD
VIGAISHAVQCTGKPFFAVAVAPIKLLPRLGLDIEIEASVEPGIWPLVFSPRELQTLSRTPTEWRRVSAQFLWCAKEAATKVARLPIDPIDIEIDLREVDATFTASIGAQNFALGRVGRVSALQFAVAF